MRILSAFSIATVLIAFHTMPVTFAKSISYKGVCAITAGTNGGQKFATLKCYKKSEPGNYKIRSTIWERDDKKAYRKRARFSGRKFNCTLTKGGTSTSGTRLIVSTRFKISDCR